MAETIITILLLTLFICIIAEAIIRDVKKGKF